MINFLKLWITGVDTCSVHARKEGMGRVETLPNDHFNVGLRPGLVIIPG